MIIEDNKIKADEGKALKRKEDSATVSTVTEVYLSPSDSADNWTDCDYGDPAVPTRYSVRKIIGELKTANKFAAVRALLETQKETNGYDWLFVGSNYLASDDPDFAAICAAIVAAGIMTQAELDAMLPKCLWEQTPMA